jgi:hypothetical protein
MKGNINLQESISVTNKETSLRKRQHAFTEDFSGYSKPVNDLNGQGFLLEYGYLLTLHEKKEILKYNRIYFAGTHEAKEERNKTKLISSKNN